MNMFLLYKKKLLIYNYNEPKNKVINLISFKYKEHIYRSILNRLLHYQK
jgi:hypothetical protein